MSQKLQSCLCTQAQMESEVFRRWARTYGDGPGLHRKYWEWYFITQALAERGLLRRGRRGLGFGVGRERLAAMFARYGCQVVATDLHTELARQRGWVDGRQYSETLEALNQEGLCDPALFRQRVTFRHADMNDIPRDLRGFDFTWSSCSFEHLGSIEHGLRFVENQMDCLKPGGVAVHTTEFNVSSDADTVTEGPTVLFRRRDIEELVGRLRGRGHRIDVDFDPGQGAADRYVDLPPYTGSMHLKLRIEQYVSTSIALVIEKKGRFGLVGKLVGRVRRRVA